MSYYHYTKGSLLGSIVREGMIRTSDTLIDQKEKPSVWLTKSPEWEVSCNISIVKNGHELIVGKVYSSDEIEIVTCDNEHMKKEVGMCRILISERISTVSMAKFKHVSGISPERYQALDKLSRNAGSPVEEWFCTFKPIPSRFWEGIEMFVDDQWVRWDEEMPIQKFIDLCLSCNGKQVQEEEKLINGFPRADAQSQINFMERHHDEIKEIWEANKDKKGYIEIYITPDYNPYPQGFQFIEKRFKRTSFKTLRKSETDSYALVHFLWEATFMKNKLAVAI